MTIFLTSSPSGPLDGSRKVDGLDEMNGFVENLRWRWKWNAKCLIIAASPDAWFQNDEMTHFFADAVARKGLNWSCFDLWDSRSRDFSKEVLLSYDVLFLGGGHVPTENHFFEKMHLRENIQEFSGIVIGISAGTMNCAETVYAQPELPGEGRDPEYQKFLRGLGLTQTMVLPHYQMTKDVMLDDMRLYEEITFGDSFGKRFLALPDGSYLLAENGIETVYGEAYEISDGTIRKICDTDYCVDWAKQQ